MCVCSHTMRLYKDGQQPSASATCKMSTNISFKADALTRAA